MRRREFVRLAAGLGVAAGFRPVGSARPAPSRRGGVGMYINLQDPVATMETVKSLGMDLCEVYTEDVTLPIAEKLAAAASSRGISIAAIITLGPGETLWNFHDGPVTIGLVSRQYRQARIEHLKKASDFARKAGIPAIETHVGFIPENPGDPLYGETLAAIKEIVGYCRSNGQQFFYHAGQESSITLLRTIIDVGLDNQRVGLDTANPIMYGKGNPVDYVEVLGKYLGLVNFKDSLWPIDGKELGREVPIPQGKVDFRRLVRKLNEVGYRGPMVIEREISGPQFLRDVRFARDYIEGLLKRP